MSAAAPPDEPLRLFAGALAPCTREGAAYAVDARRHVVYAFGGVGYLPDGGSPRLSSGLSRYDVHMLSWTALQPCDVPECAVGVRYATALCHGDALWLFGGDRKSPPHFRLRSPSHYVDYSPVYRPPSPTFDFHTTPPPAPLGARFDFGTGAWTALPASAGNAPPCFTDRPAMSATLASGVAVLFGADEGIDSVSLFTFATEQFTRQETTGNVRGLVTAVCASLCGRYVYTLYDESTYSSENSSLMRLDSQTWAWEALGKAAEHKGAHLLALPCGNVLSLTASGYSGMLWEPARGAWRGPVPGPNPNGGALSGVAFSAAALVGGQMLLLLGGVHARSGDCVQPVLHAPLAGGCGAALDPLARDLRSALLDTATLADVSLLADGGALLAHRAILVARSAYFKAMLTGGLKEGAQAEVALPTVSLDALRRVLEWLYTGHVALGDGDVQGVLEAASLFALEPLLELVIEHVRATLSLDNALAWLLVARARGVAQLHTACLAFITLALARGEAGGTSLLAQLRASNDVPRDLLVELLESVAMGRASRKRGRVE